MAQQLTSGGLTYTSSYDIDINAIVDKIKKAQAGENVPGVNIIKLPSLTDGDKDEASASLPIMTLLLLGTLAFVILKPSRK